MLGNRRPVLLTRVIAVFVVLGFVALAAGRAQAVTDTTAPNLVGFSFTPDTIDTSAAARTITVTAQITDDVTGLGSYGTSVTFSSPSGNRSSTASFDSSKRISGTAQDGTYRSSLVVPRYAEQGTWRITYASLNDAAGHARYISTADLTAAGFPTTFVQTAVGDATPPVLAAFSFTPVTVDTSAAARTITVTAHITDDVSGLGYGYVTFTSPSGTPSLQAYFDSSKRISGTALDGTYRTTIVLSRYSEQGTWQVTSASLFDAATNYRSLSSSDIANAGFPTTLEQTAVGDATAPVLAGFSFTPVTVDTSAAERVVTVTAHITDAVSGSGSGTCCYNNYVTFSSPTSARTLQAYFDSSKRISGTAQDGTYQAAIIVPRYSEQGTWRIVGASLSDAAGNYRTLSPADFADAGFPTTFEQTATGDATPPVLVAFGLTPATIDTSAAARTITVTARISDDVSGLANPSGCCSYSNSVTFRAPSGSRSVSANFDSSNRVSGTALDGVYQASMVVPRYAEMGTWQLTSASFADVAGNYRSLSTADFANAGFATAFQQTAVGDSTPPVIAGFNITPNTVDTSTAARTVTIRAHITDDLVGMGPATPSFLFTSPSLGQTTVTPADGTRFVSGTARDGIYEFDAVVPRFAETGTWRLNTTFLADALGNSRTLSAADLSAAGFPTTFVVATVTTSHPGGDFDGDGTTDFAVYRPSTGQWLVHGGATSSWGLDGDIPVPGDYDGNGTTDLAVYRPSTGQWFVNGGATTNWGFSTDIPVPGDYDGDGTTDPAVYRPSTGQWLVHGGATTNLGLSNDIPVPGDYDGDGTTDPAVWRPSTGQWFVSGGVTTSFGLNGDVPVPGDYDGNGTTDPAVWRPSTGQWFVSGGVTTSFGLNGDVPVPGDYDGNGTTDFAVWRPSTGQWFVLGIATTSWGLSSDIPLPISYAIRSRIA